MKLAVRSVSKRMRQSPTCLCFAPTPTRSFLVLCSLYEKRSRDAREPVEMLLAHVPEAPQTGMCSTNVLRGAEYTLPLCACKLFAYSRPSFDQAVSARGSMWHHGMLKSESDRRKRTTPVVALRASLRRPESLASPIGDFWRLLEGPGGFCRLWGPWRPWLLEAFILTFITAHS